MEYYFVSDNRKMPRTRRNPPPEAEEAEDEGKKREKRQPVLINNRSQDSLFLKYSSERIQIVCSLKTNKLALYIYEFDPRTLV